LERDKSSGNNISKAKTLTNSIQENLLTNFSLYQQNINLPHQKNKSI
jgi:hypothetical protein